MAEPLPNTDTETIRFGILGCAGISRKLARAIQLSPRATLRAVGSRSLDKARAFAAACGLSAATLLHASYDAVLDDPDVDAVYVPLPTRLHVEWAVRAARRGKHVLLEKPAAVTVRQLDVILEACDASGVQFMDGTMWMHHPRTTRMEQFLRDAQRFGHLKAIQTSSTFAANDDFLANDIRVKPDLDALGALGDVGWYCIRAALWAADYELPKSAAALRNPVKNEAGVILSCGASLHWEDGRVGTFFCSFLAHYTMDITAIGTKGTLRVSDFIIPRDEVAASYEYSTGFESREDAVGADFPQEVCMVNEFSALAEGIKRRGSAPEKKWAVLCRKTQLVMDAVMASIDRGFEPVEIL